MPESLTMQQAYEGLQESFRELKDAITGPALKEAITESVKEELTALKEAMTESVKGELTAIKEAITDAIIEALQKDRESRPLGKYQTWGDECSLCLLPLLGHKLGRLPCDHHFHHACIIRWVTRIQRCPVCRHRFHYQA